MKLGCRFIITRQKILLESTSSRRVMIYLDDKLETADLKNGVNNGFDALTDTNEGINLCRAMRAAAPRDPRKDMLNQINSPSVRTR
jgi:hypothetical protein